MTDATPERTTDPRPVIAFCRKQTSDQLALLITDSDDPLVRNQADAELWLRCTVRVEAVRHD